MNSHTLKFGKGDSSKYNPEVEVISNKISSGSYSVSLYVCSLARTQDLCIVKHFRKVFNSYSDIYTRFTGSILWAAGVQSGQHAEHVSCSLTSVR